MAGVLALFSGCAAKQARLGHSIPTPKEQEKRLVPGETVYLVSTAIDGNSAGFPSAIIDSAGEACFLLGVKVHVGGLTPAEATAAVQKAYQPRYFIHWDFIVSRVQQECEVGSAPG
jgi:hypothetical protein